MKPIEDQVILGINDTHDASACISIGGKVICAASEERFRRTKSAGGFPAGAIEACLKDANLTRADIDLVALAGTRSVPVNLLGTLSTFTVADHIKIQEEKRRPFFYEGKVVPLAELFPNFKPKSDPNYPLDQIPLKESSELSKEELARIDDVRLNYIADWLEIDRSNIHRFDHHTCHAYFAYYASPYRGEKVAALTMDAGGDGVYDSVGCFDEAGQYSRIHASHECIIGPLYSMVTLMLGMRPAEEEFKVMGLAPYVREHNKKQTRDILISFLTLNGVKFKRSPELRDLFFYVRDLLRTQRFDGISGGLQDFTEHFITHWVSAALDATGSRKITFSGGVAQNVKANMVIEELPNLQGMFVPPAAGDESLSIGACWALMDQLADGGSAHRKLIEPLKNAYLGPDFNDQDIDDFAAHPNVKGRYRVAKGNGEMAAAQALADNKVIGVCRGRMEFGPRALGHRSILANPSSPQTIDQINEAVKGRDFWMPFAPSVISESLNDYVDVRGKAELRFMTHCLPSTPLGEEKIAAGLHPRDKTARVQEVLKDAAPDYHSLISRFKDLTGCGGVLNTSLNIHGKPIVNKPTDIANELLAAQWVNIDGFLVGERYFEKVE